MNPFLKYENAGLGPGNRDRSDGTFNTSNANLPSSAGLSSVGNTSGNTSSVNSEFQEVYGFVPLDKLLIDVTIVNAVKAYRPDIAKEIMYDFEVIDQHLFPLKRMEGMMQDLWDIERPSISIQRSGRLYSVIDGRHRVARAFILGEKRIKTGHEDFITSGGESNPGPPRKPNQRRKSTEPDAIAKTQLRSYHLTKVYNRYLAQKFPSRTALDRANTWVRANIDDIDPSCTPVCSSCGEASLIFCEHYVAEAPPVSPPVELVEPIINLNQGVNSHQRGLNLSFMDRFRNIFTSPHFDLSKQNNHYLGSLTSGDLHDNCIIPGLYNYITVNMQTSYKISGKDDRDVRLAHCHRLFLRWSKDHLEHLENDTMYKNRCLITVQRACDQGETEMIYQYSNPKRNFGLAWFVKFLFQALFIAFIKTLLITFVFLVTISLVLNLLTYLGLAPEETNNIAINTFKVPPNGNMERYMKCMSVKIDYSSRVHFATGTPY